MRVLVVGATGAIGRSLIKSLRLAGHTIFGMVRSQRVQRARLRLGCRTRHSRRARRLDGERRLGQGSA